MQPPVDPTWRVDPQDAAALAGTQGDLLTTSPSGILFAALIVCAVITVAHRIVVVGHLRAHLSVASRAWLAALTGTVAYAQAVRLHREIRAWMALPPEQRGVLIIPGEVVAESRSTR